MAHPTSDEQMILRLLGDWVAGVQRRDYDAVLKHHAQDIVMFDVPEPFQSAGIDAYRKTWDLFFGWVSDPPKFELSNIRVTAGADVAFVTAHGRCFGPDDNGTPTDIDFRLTICLRKIGEQWIVQHEHHSVPAS